MAQNEICPLCDGTGCNEDLDGVELCEGCRGRGSVPESEVPALERARKAMKRRDYVTDVSVRVAQGRYHLTD